MSMSVSPDVLAGHWVHSHEEDTPTARVFRPASFNFPRSRGRESFVLQSDGTLIRGKPGPTDQTERAGGRWELKGGDQPQLQLNPDGSSPVAYNIVSADKDKLVIKNA